MGDEVMSPGAQGSCLTGLSFIDWTALVGYLYGSLQLTMEFFSFKHLPNKSFFHFRALFCLSIFISVISLID